MLRTIFAILLVTFLVGCRQPAFNPTPTQGESDSLTDIVQLTRDFDRAGEAYFLYNKTSIIFQATRGGDPRYQMYLADLNWSAGKPSIHRTIRISPENSSNTCGFFSPDGMSLIFASTAGKEVPSTQPSGYQRQGGQYKWDFPKGMEIYRADGWEGAIFGVDRVNLAQHPLTNNDAYDAECAFSPDGKRIVFCSNRTGDPELFVMDADGGNVKQLTHSPGYDGGPFFSPDGKSIVWRTDRKQKDLLQIHVADLVGDKLVNEKALTDDQNVNWAPFWHPDGRHIVYTTSMHGHQNYEVYLMRRDGSHKTRITFADGFDGLPVLSPDGKWLMWSSKRSGKVQVTIARFTLPKGS